MNKPGRFPWLVAVILIVEATSAHGETDQGVVVLLGCEAHYPAEAWPEVERRLAAEIRVLGLDVSPTDATAPSLPERIDELISQSQDLGAIAGIMLFREGSDVVIQLWLDDEASDLLVRRHIVESDVQSPDAIGQVALSTVELLHASLLEANLISSPTISAIAPDPEPPPPPPSSSTEEELPREEPEPEDQEEPSSEADDATESSEGNRRQVRRFRARARVDVSLPFDPLWAMVAIDVGGGIRPLPWLAIDLDAQVTLSPYEIWSDNAVSEHLAASFTTTLFFEPFFRSRVRAGFGVGGGVFLTWALGYSTIEGSNTPSVTMASGLVAISFRLVIPVTNRLRVLFNSNVKFALPTIDVFHMGERVGTIGYPPMLDLGLGLEWGLGSVLRTNR